MPITYFMPDSEVDIAIMSIPLNERDEPEEVKPEVFKNINTVFLCDDQ